ncbi:UDP-N-acetylmuramate--L-alanine ligase [Ruminococcaceae bacterium OttesenSCG-928-I18]|nr:UDP-N-acetylmuramate--L-alanine ligase [Ruminococcaceae bacterium OttesenSCG-928-I18]
MDVELRRLLESPKTLHFIGVGGSGMYPLVQIMLEKGHTLQGSDVNEGDILAYERKKGVRVMMGHKPENIDGADLVVYSAAIRPDNPERLEAERRGIPCVERSVMLGYVASLYETPLCIAGTHGKTTTTGMTVQILESAGFDPAAVIGGKLPLIHGYGKGGKGGAIVVEACEFHDTFLALTPDTAVLLNIDNDHLDYFGSMENLKASFRKFCARATGQILYNGDDAQSREVVAGLPQPKTSFGLGEGNELRAVNLREHRPSCWSFDVVERGQTTGTASLAVPGRHNIHNALAAYGAARRAGASARQCFQGLASFGGAGRRFETLGQVDGFTVVDDYAHHPAELEVTLRAATQMDYREVWAIFQPYTFSRTQQMLDEFAKALSLADHVVMTAVMGGRERAEDYRVTTEDIAKNIPGSVWFETQREVANHVLAHAQPGDLVITLGCGDIYKCAHMLLESSQNEGMLP